MKDMIDFSLGKIQPSKSRSQRISHSRLNSFHFIVVMMAIIPLLVWWKLDGLIS